MRFLCGCIALVLILSGCTSTTPSQPREIILTKDSQNAVIVIGIKGWGWWDFVWSPIDPKSMTKMGLDDGIIWFGEECDGLLVCKDKGYIYYVQEIKPGAWVADFSRNNYARRTSNFCKGSVMFSITPGEVLYVGNFEVGDSTRVTPADFEEAKKALANHKSISVALRQARLVPVPGDRLCPSKGWFD